MASAVSRTRVISSAEKSSRSRRWRRRQKEGRLGGRRGSRGPWAAGAAPPPRPPGGGHVLAHVVGADGQLPVAPIHQHRELDALRPPVVDEGVQGGADAAA